MVAVIGSNIIPQLKLNPSGCNFVQVGRQRDVIAVIIKFSVDNRNSLVNWVSILGTWIANVGEVSINISRRMDQKKAR